MEQKKSFFSRHQSLTAAVSVVASVVAVAGFVYATTIGSAISVDTTLTVTGASTFNGSSTFGDAAADVNLFTGTLQASTTALFTSGLTSYSTVTINGTASTTNLVVGGNGTSLAGVIAGVCNIPLTTVSASTTAYADCADATGVRSGDKVLVMATSSFPGNMFLQAASSSVTTAGAINVRMFNLGVDKGYTAGALPTTVAASVFFWAFR